MLEDMIYLIAGYAVFVITTAVFIYSMVSRQQSLHKELKALKMLQQNDITLKE